MTFINYASREINCKIVYYGPGLCGKTTNLQHIFESTAPQARGKLISSRDGNRSHAVLSISCRWNWERSAVSRLAFISTPYRARFFMMPRAGLSLKGVDGVVFVADSQEERMDANVESLYNLEENLQSQGYDLMKLPYVLQLNKRDLPNIIPVEDLDRRITSQKWSLSLRQLPSSGAGVFDTLKAVAKQVLTELRKG